MSDNDDGGRAGCARTLRPGDVVLVKASRAPGSTSWREALLEAAPDTGPTRRWPADEGDPASRRAGAGRSRCSARVLRDPLLARKGYGQLIRDDGPTTPPHQARHARPWAASVIILASTIAYLLAKLLDRTPAVGLRAADAVPLRRARRGRLPRRLHQDRQAAQPRAAQPRQDDRPAARRASPSALLALQFPDERGQTPASRLISFTRDWERGRCPRSSSWC